MAQMSFKNITSNSCTISITGLQVYDANDPNSVNYTRVARIYMSTISLPPSSVSGTPDAISSNIAKEDSSATISLKALDPSTTYYVRCNFYEFGKYNQYLATLTGKFTTKEESSGGEWTLTNSYIADPDTTQYVAFDLGKMECRMIRMYFATTGKVTVTVSGGSDIVSYLGTTSKFYSSTGMPGEYTYSGKNDCSFSFDYSNINDAWYLHVRPSTSNGVASNITITIVPPGVEETEDYFQWSSSVAQGLPIKNVSHTEWDSFIDKIIAVLTDKGIQNQPITTEKYGYTAGTTYRTMLRDCYMKYDADLQGYPLTAQMFNIARFIIGSNAPGGSGILEDKISKTSKVLASDFIKLENSLKAWQG